jgi:hypothetical protein
MRSPLKEQTKKTAAIGYIKDQIFSQGASVDTYCFYAGECELNLAAQDYRITAHTNSYVLYEFWRSVMEEPEKIYEIIASPDFNFDSEEYFNVLQEKWYTYRNRYLRSALFFMLNRCSDTGLTSSGQIDQTNFTPLSIAAIKNFKAPDYFSLNYIKKPTAELSTIIDVNTDANYIYIPIGDFSYNLFEGGKNYGPEQTKVNNRSLKKVLNKTDKKILLHYNSHKALTRFYKGHNITMINRFGKATEDFDEAQEFLVANF